MGDIPTCHYYADKHCARPKECPVHACLLRRPFKKLHRLRPELECFSWERNAERKFHRTHCGLFLHRYKPEVPPELGFGDSLDWHHKMEYELGYKPAPVASGVPDLIVYYQVGWSRREIIVTSLTATCKVCAGG
jgi:hypothetical protein